MDARPTLAREKKEEVGKESKLIWKDRRKKLGFMAMKVTLSMLFISKCDRLDGNHIKKWPALSQSSLLIMASPRPSQYADSTTRNPAGE